MSNSKETIKIFIASAGDVQEERKECILLLNEIGKSHKHLHLDPIEWEYDISGGSNPEYPTIQDAINPKLSESQLVIFIFYSRIGINTLKEFELAVKEKKKIYVFRKEGFSPDNKSEHEGYGSLIEFYDTIRVDDNLLVTKCKDFADFKLEFNKKLNFYLSGKYSIALNIENSPRVKQLKQLLGEKTIELEEVKIQINSSNKDAQIKQLENNIKQIRNELLQSEEVRKQQAKEKVQLEAQLAPQIAKDKLKAQAFEAVQKEDYETAEILLKESAKESIIETASTFFEIGKINKLQFKYQDALEYFELASKIKPDNVLYLNETGALANNLGYYEKAIDCFLKGLEFIKDNQRDENKDITALYNNLGLAYSEKAEYEKAIECYIKALNIDKHILGDEHPTIAIYYNNIGTSYNDNGEYEKAIDCYNKALFINKKFYGENHISLAAIYSNLSIALNGKGDYNKSIEFSEIALSIDININGDQHPDVAVRYNNLGLAYKHKGDSDKAIFFYNKALENNKMIFGEEHPKIATDYNNIGAAYRAKGDYDSAIRFYKKAINIDKVFFGSEHPNIAIDYNNLGLAYLNIYDFENAINFLEISLEIMKKFQRLDHPSVQNIQDNLAFAVAAKNKP